MVNINQKRVLLGSVFGFLAWSVWSGALNFVLLASRYPGEQAAGHLLKHHPFPLYWGSWLMMILMMSAICAQLYAGVRASLGPGPKTALRIGVLVAFVGAMPIELTTSRFPIAHIFTVCWIVDLVVGAISATLVAGWIYRD